MNTHIDQMKEWWDGAEQGPFRKGDTVIRFNDSGNGYKIYEAQADNEDQRIRILARKPKPKPAWRNAVAVIARVDDGSQHPDTSRVALLRDTSEPGQWVRGYCDNVYTDELSDVTPLIPAVVTDGMVVRATHAAVVRGVLELTYGMVDKADHERFRAILTAALGLEAR